LNSGESPVELAELVERVELVQAVEIDGEVENL
jgi:hypothetical protein